MTVDGKTYKVPQPFAVFATQNPVEHIGTYPLPEAQLDRFFIRLSLGYPSAQEELQMIERFNGNSPIDALSPVTTTEVLLKLQELVHQIHVSPQINEFIVSIVRKTREHPDIVLGCSPRGTLALYRGAQAWALYQNRSYVLPDDVLKMAVPVLAHRLVLSQEARFKKFSPQDLMKNVISLVKVPR